MPRVTVTSSGYNELTAHDSQAAWIWFLTIGLHPRETGLTLPSADADGKLRVCNNNFITRAPISPSDGTLVYWNPYPFDFVPPGADASRSAPAKLAFDNIDRLLVDTLRRAEYQIQVDVGLGPTYGTNVTDDENETAYCDGYELWESGLDLTNVSWDVQTISGTLIKDNVLGRAFPSNHPIHETLNFPGLFGAEDVVTTTEE